LSDATPVRDPAAARGALRVGSVAPLVVPVGALALTLLVAGGALALGGYDPVRALRALALGAFGSPDAVLSVTLVRAVPLVLTGLAVALAFRGGIWNIGAEGQLYAGAIAAAWVGLSGRVIPAPLLLPALLAASAVAGAAWAWFPAFLKVRRGVGEVITTLLLNYVALNVAAWVVRGPLQEPRGVFPSTEEIAVAARLPVLVPGSRLHLGFAIAVLLALAVWVLLRFTAFGFRLRALGASPDAAAASARVDASRLTYRTFMLSGALAGLAGGIQLAGVPPYVFYDLFSPGTGYTAIAVALLAGLRPIAVLATGTFFGALEGGAGAMQRVAGIPAAWAQGIEALVILSVIALDSGLRTWRSSRT
jgi:general nucleoside transport system permease protein